MSSTVTYHVGDVRDHMAAMPDHSVDLIVTSPPFLALRSYLPADHPDKHREIGSEPTPAAYLQTLLELTAEWRRLLTPTGSLCVELGDTYSGSGGGGGDYLEGGMREGQPGFGGSAERQREGNAAHWRQKNTEKNGWPLPKSLCGIPTLYTWSLAYGRNLLTGQPSPAGQWRVRNLLAWTRPNPPVGALGDKFRPATSYVTVGCVSANRWFDLDAVRHEHTDRNPDRFIGKIDQINQARSEVGLSSANGYSNGGNPAGAPPLDWHHDEPQDWQPLHRLPTAPYPGTHYATYPLALPRKLIEAMCPRQVCRQCGEPRRRITRTDGVGKSTRGLQTARLLGGGRADGSAGWERTLTITLGWSDCGCGDPIVIDDDTYDRQTFAPKWRPGHVLDPFCGSGTTLLAAALTGRDATGIDLDPRNKHLTFHRIADACHVRTYHATNGHVVWTVDPELPGIKHEHPDQQSLFG